MWQTINFVLALSLSFLLVQCSHNPVSSETRDLTTAEKRVVESGGKFGLKLFREVVQEDPDKNVFISPLSVSMALGMTLNGADGETRDAMERTLELNGMTTDKINESYKSLIELLTKLDPNVVFQIANSIWYRQGLDFEQEFIEVNQTYFDAVVSALNFNDPASADIINRWVKDNTNGLIEKIVESPIDPQTIMFLINAIYFKGTWTVEFDPDRTRDDVFTKAEGEQTRIKMMNLKTDLPYFENDTFQAVDLPYGNERFRMTVLLPKQGVDLDSLISSFNPSDWNQWMSEFSEHEVKLQLPKFKLEYKITLNDILKALGMAVAFEPYEADFTKLYSGPENAYISNVKHKTFVEVDEEGTEAAAVTSVEVTVTSVGPQPITMRVDHPFAFAIRESQSGTVLFIGKIVEPTL